MKLAALAVVALVGVFALVARDRHLASGHATQASPPGPYRGSEPPPGITAPDFDLKSFRGRRLSMRSLRGNVVVLTFLDTKCRDKCPVVASVIGRALPLVPTRDRARVKAVAISVQPRLDTPLRIEHFLRARHALALDYVTGTVRALRPVWKAFGVVSAVDTGDADAHSSDVRIFDRRGVWVSTLRAGVDLTPQNLAHDVVVALRR